MQTVEVSHVFIKNLRGARWQSGQKHYNNSTFVEKNTDGPDRASPRFIYMFHLFFAAVCVHYEKSDKDAAEVLLRWSGGVGGVGEGQAWCQESTDSLICQWEDADWLLIRLSVYPSLLIAIS